MQTSAIIILTLTAIGILSSVLFVRRNDPYTLEKARKDINTESSLIENALKQKYTDAKMEVKDAEIKAAVEASIWKHEVEERWDNYKDWTKAKLQQLRQEYLDTKILPEKPFQRVKESFKEGYEQSKQKAHDMKEGAKEGLKDTWDATKDKTLEAKEGLKEGWEATKDKAYDVKEGMQSGAEYVKDLSEDKFQHAKEFGKEAANTVLDKTEKAGEFVEEKSEEAKFDI